MEENRFDVLLVILDPTSGHEIGKTRPCTVIPPDETLGYNPKRCRPCSSFSRTDPGAMVYGSDIPMR